LMEDDGTFQHHRKQISCGDDVCPLFVTHISRRLTWQGLEFRNPSVWKLTLKNRIVIWLVLVFLIADFAHPGMAQSEKLGFLRIKAEYPVQVPRSYTFQVNLTVEYAFRDYYEIHAAVYEGTMGMLSHPLWESGTERLIDVGEKAYSLQLKSPAQEGQWLLTGYAFFQNASGPAYFTDQERGPGFVEVSIKVADNAKLTLRTPHGNMPVSVDGTAFATDQNGILVRELRVLTEHSVTAPGNVSMAEGWRAIFRSWNGTDNENPKTLVIKTDLSLTVDYQDEFRLDVMSNVTQGTGAGWYPAGAVANYSVPMLVPQRGLAGTVGIKWRFTGWSGDINSTNTSNSVVMDHPHRVTANWVVDYGQLYYLAIGLAVLVAGAVAAFVGLRVRKKPAGEEVEPVAPSARIYCMFCGAGIDPDARFCSKCGRSQVSSG
jgi:hypothetical protein